MTLSPTQSTLWICLIGQGAETSALEPETEPARIAERLRGPDARGVIIYRRPAAALACAMRRAPCREALSNWREAAETIISLHRRHRQVLTLICAPGQGGDDAHALRAFQAAFPYSQWPSLDWNAGDEESELEPLAALLIQSQTAALDAFERLQAASTHPGPELGSAVDLVDETAGLLREQAEEAETINQGLARQVSDLEAAVLESDAALARAREKCVLLTEEKLRLDAAWRRQLAEQAEQLADLNTRLHEVYASSSWRLTRPVRAVGRLARGAQTAGA